MFLTRYVLTTLFRLTSERQINRYKGDRCCRVRGHDYLVVGPAQAREMRCARPFALNIYQGMPGLSRLAP